jgi:hypothetical protein
MTRTSTLFVALCALALIPTVAQAQTPESWELRVSGGYPTIASFGAGVRVAERVVLAVDLGVMHDNGGNLGGLTGRAGATWEAFGFDGGSVFFDAGALRIQGASACLESDPLKCKRASGWAGEFGAGVSFFVGEGALRFEGFAIGVAWDKPVDYDAAKRAYGTDGVPELFEIRPGARFTYAF